ncbi:hypothetical protein RclHR1_09320014 [Rhizophagus clarus]|uniref:Uncharacterized protein n=1 Tax=Rhizophagus clarus TaxID=94130 RepID=A0A2Z6SA49_9GLOM|nr:hypothetical protein RclHR1_09320014 [Rhizophagus clarus]
MYMKLRCESYTDMELVELQTSITEFCQEFVNIFSEYSSSSCKIPKLHVRHYYLAAKQKAAKPKSRSSSSFRNLLWEFNEGFDNLRAGFEEFLTENDINYDDQSGYFKIYSSVAVKSTDIIRTAASFYGNEWFSNVIVSSEETDWYGKVLLLLEFFVEKDKELINLVLL